MWHHDSPPQGNPSPLTMIHSSAGHSLGYWRLETMESKEKYIVKKVLQGPLRKDCDPRAASRGLRRGGIDTTRTGLIHVGAGLICNPICLHGNL